MNYLKIAPYAVIMLLAGVGGWYFRKAENLNRDYLNALAVAGKVVAERDGVYSRLLEIEDKIKGLREDSTFKDLRIRELLDVVKTKNARITALVAFQATWKPESVTIPGRQDTVYIGRQARDRVTFATEIQGDSVYGYTLTSPPEAVIGLRKRPVSFAVALIEGPGGQYETVLTSDNPYLTISAASGKVVPYDAHRGFLARFFAGPEVSIGWSRDRGVVAQAQAAVWRIEPYVEVNEKGLDYGGRVRVWER